MPRFSKELGREYDAEAKNAAVAAHVLSVLTGPVGPLLVLSNAPENQPFARFHATQAAIFGAIALPVIVVTCGLALALLVPIAAHSALRAAWGDWFAYPVLGRFAA
jgi:hypothetical protein